MNVHLRLLPVGDELQYLDEELSKAFPPHFALQLHLVTAETASVNLPLHGNAEDGN